jgi:hypothetical protein
LKIGAASQQFRQILLQNEKKDKQKRFERWKFLYLSKREGFQVITQTKHLELQFSDSSLSRPALSSQGSLIMASELRELTRSKSSKDESHLFSHDNIGNSRHVGKSSRTTNLENQSLAD